MGPSKIIEAFRVQLETAVSKTLIVNENYKFTPPASGLWYEEYCIVDDEPVTDKIGLGSNIRYLGFYQINVHSDKGVGKGYAVQEAERLRPFFKPLASLIYEYNVPKTTLVTVPNAVVFGAHIAIVLKSFGYSRGYEGALKGEYILPIRISWTSTIES